MTDPPFDRRDLLKTTGAGLLGSGVSSTSTGAQSDDRIEWQYETDGGIYGGPTIVDGTAFVGCRVGNVYAIDIADGTERWRFETGSYFDGSPTVVDGTVYIGSNDNHVYAIDAADGTERWRFETDGEVETSPTVADGTVYVGTTGSTFYALHAVDGGVRWTFDAAELIRSSATVVDGTVYFGDGESTASVYALDARDGSQQWVLSASRNVKASPTVADGTVFIGSNVLYALDAVDGTERWTVDIGRLDRGATVADGTVFIGNDEGELYAIDAADGTERWRFDTGDRINRAPTVAGDAVVVANSNGGVYAVDRADGTERWRGEIGLYGQSSPVVVDGTVYIGSTDSNLYAFRADVDASSSGSRVRQRTLGHHDQIDPFDLTISPAVPLTGEQVTFDASATEGDFSDYEWAFGDGTTATGETAEHTYDATGRYEVQLTATRSDGTQAETVERISVGDPDEGGDAGVTAAFEYAPEDPRVDDRITVDGGASEGVIYEYDWRFGAGNGTATTATGQRAAHSFDESGTYDVQLRVAGRPANDSDDQMTVDTTTATVVVDSSDDGTTISAISVSPSHPTVGTAVTFSVQTGDSDPRVDWTFGDESTASGRTVTHTYEQAGTYQIQATTDGASASTEIEVSERSVEVTELSRRLGGELLPGLPVDETVEATVETDDTTLDRVEFDYADETTTSDSAPHDAQFDVGTFDAPGEAITIRAVDANGVVDREPTEIPVTDLTPWLEFLLGLDEVLTVEPIVTEDSVTIDIFYDPLGALDVGIELPDDVVGSGTDASDRQQSFGFGGIDFGGSYDPIARSARLRGGGEITATMMRADVTAGVRASGTVTSDLELIDPVGGVSAEADVTIPSLGPVPMSIPIPGTNSTIGIEPTITPGIDGEFRFSNDFDFQDGTITPGVDIRIETGIEVENPVGFGSVGLSVATEGKLDIEFEVGNGDPEPLGEIAITGEVSLGLGLEFVIEGEIISATFGPGAESQQVALTDGLDYSLRQQSGPGTQALPEVDSVDAGLTPAAAVDPLSTTRTADLFRVTDREYEDTEPAVAVLDDGTYLVAWSQQASDKPQAAGRDIVVRTYQDGTWTDTAVVTDNSVSDVAPVAAATDDGRALLAWITYTIDATDSDVDAETYLGSAELTYAVYDGSTWTDPTVLTDTAVRQQRPTVAADENGWLVAWQSLDDTSTTIRTARIADATTDPTVTDWGDGASPDLGARSDDGVDLAYVSTDGESVTGVVHHHVVGTDIENEQTYDTTDARSVATSDGRVLWTAGGQDTRRIVDAGGSSPTELTVRDAVTAVGELDLSTVGDRTVLSYRARFTDSENRDLVYRLDRGRGWIRDRRIAGGPANQETLWHSATAPLPTSDDGAASFVTAYAVSKPQSDAVNDIFVTKHGFAPDYALDATVEKAAAGEETTVSYTVENRGDVAGTEPVTVSVQGAETTTIDESPLDTGASVTGTATVSVPDDGSIDCSIDVDEPMLGTEPTERSLVAATPALRVADVSAIRRDQTTADVTIAVRNAGDAVTGGVPIVVTDGDRQLLAESIDGIGPDETATVETTVDPTKLALDTPQEITIDPDGTVPDRAIDQRRRTVPLVRPDLTLEAVRYRTDSGVAFVDALLSNAGPGAAAGSYRLLDADGTQLAEDRLAVAPAIDGEPQFEQVSVRAEGLTVDATVEHRITTDVGNLASEGLVRTDTVEAFLPASLLTAEQYATPDGRIELDGLRTAVSDWQADRIETELLVRLIDAWGNE